MKNLSFWAQSLDNQSPDLILKNGKELSDDELRQQFISKIYKIPNTKRETQLNSSKVNIRSNNSEFVIEAIPTEKDRADRLAPIVIYGEIPEELSREWIESLCNEIDEVIKNKINRTLSTDTIATIRDWLVEILKKKKKVERQNNLMSLITVFLLARSWINRFKQFVDNINLDTNNGQTTEDSQNKVGNTITQNHIQKREAVDMNHNAISPKRCRAILVLSPHDLTRLEYTPEANNLLLNEQVHLLVPTDESASPLEESLENSGLLVPGTLSILNPYNTLNYVSIDKASSTFALAKYLHFTTLCGLLGAREVTVEQIEVKTLKGKQVFKSFLNSPYVTGNLGGESKTFEEIRNNIKINSKFEGGQPDLDKAENHLQQYHLLNDISMSSLLEQRKGSNPIKSRELTISLSEESNRNFQVISDVKIPIYANLQAQVDLVKKELYEFTLTIKVQF